MIKSEICDLLGIKYPVFQGGMAWISDASLASAVSNAGGLGLISAINYGVDEVRQEIRKCKKLTDKPFGVNIMLMNPFVDDIAQMVIEEGVSVLTTGAGMPSKYMKDWLGAGIKVIPVVASVAVAKRVEMMGATAIIAEGSEAGGHVGNLNTLVLVPQIVDAVSIPVLAAGGIADGRGLASALILGAKGVQCGTCFLVANECTIHENYKKKVLSARDSDTIVTGKRFGHPVRASKNQFTKQFADMENDNTVDDKTIMDFGSGSLRKAVKDGDEKMGSFMAGQAAGLICESKPAKDIIELMVKDAEELLKKGNQFIY